jgi:alpha-beta hydrolase superfamily lysophospholipase
VTSTPAPPALPAIEIARRGVDTPTALVIVAHGGRADGHTSAGRWTMTYAWQRWVTPWVVAAVRDSPTQVWRLRYRVRGWNGAAADAAQDLLWAVREAAHRHPGVPVILVGHSMGGRASIYVAAEPNVAAVSLLAPWIEPGDPVSNLAGKPVLIVHGTGDRMTNPRTSKQVAGELGVRFIAIPGEGHTMVGAREKWRAYLTEFLTEQVAALA